MKAFICDEPGESPRLSVAELEKPRATPGTVVVRVGAAGVNFGDTLVISGKYQEKQAIPFVVGGEAAGVVVEVGPDVDSIVVGDRLVGFADTGAMAQFSRLTAARAVKVPDAVSDVQAAALFSNYGAAYCALSRRAALAQGETLLVLGGGSGLGLAAVQLGVAMGARVIAGARSGVKRATALASGAWATVDHTSPGMRDDVLQLTGHHGVDVIIDPIGGDSTIQALRTVAKFGRLIVLGFAGGEIPAIPANRLLLKNASAIGVFWGEHWDLEPEIERRAFEQLFAWLADGAISPLISQTFTLDEAAAALRSSAQGEVVGKLVVVPDGA